MNGFDDSLPELDSAPDPRKAAPEGFDSLTENAFDFLRQALTQLSTNPKYSLINFYTGLELILKARLLHEHWALVVSKPERASRVKFQEGDFQSVNLEECIMRLQEICGESLLSEKKCFDTIRKHRNRLVHFFHPSYIGKKARKAASEVAVEQFVGWMLISRLLTDQWSVQFANYSKSISELNRLIHKNRGFLEFKYNTVKSELDKYKKSGRTIATCPSCRYPSAQLRETLIKHSDFHRSAS
jgi:hypothetical protein